MMNVIAGVIGCGNISRFHFSGLEKAGAEVRWVCDLVETNARPYAEKFNARTTSDWKEIIADKEVNTIVITALSSVHKAVCLAAIAAGKAVICEKTLTENAADSLEIVKAAEAKGSIFYTSYMKRFIPAVAKAKELLPGLGRIVSTHIRSHQCWGDLWGGNPESGFFHTPSDGMSSVRRNYGGGILVCGGSHILDLIVFLLGRPHKVYGKIHQPADRDYDLHAMALLETDNGTVNFEVMAHPLHRIGFLRDGWDERVEINGVNGRLEIYSAKWDDPYCKASLLVHYDNTTGGVNEYRFDAVSPFDEAIAFFCGNIARGEQGGQSRWTGYEVDALLAHVRRSDATGDAVCITWPKQAPEGRARIRMSGWRPLSDQAGRQPGQARAVIDELLG
ncbi:MAG: Gfo/Idh/MocA family oxidoreductase [bacterium]